MAPDKETESSIQLLPTIDEAGSYSSGAASSAVARAEEELRSVKKERDETKDSLMALMEELKLDLAKDATGTATRTDKERIDKRHRELSKLKKKFDDTKHVASTRERKLMDVKTRVKEHEVLVAMKKKSIRSVIRDVCAAEAVDLAFIIDGTGSMASHIANVKNSISTIVQKVKATNGDLALRLACVCYRDLGDTNRFEVLDFVSSVDEFSTFVACLDASGGDDAPEDIAGGIQKANALSWKNATRIAFLIADAPCHGSEFHAFYDSYPSGTPGIDITRQLQKLMKNPTDGSMSIYFARVTSDTDIMVTKLQEKGIELEQVNLDEADKLTDIVTKGIRHSVFKTISMTGGSTRSLTELTGEGAARDRKLKSYHITKSKPSYPENAVLVHVYRNKPVKSMEELQAPLSVGKVKKAAGRSDEDTPRSPDKSTMYLCRTKNPFAQGQIRIAFYGQLAKEKRELLRPRQRIILKTFKHTGSGANNRQEYLHQMEISNIVFFLALAYNKSRYRPSHCAKIRCLECCVVEEVLDVHETKGMRRFCAEEPLPIPPGADFVKYSNNTGYWNMDELDESLLRFADFTYRVTDGYLMATDLQGIKVENQFYLTDPVILCKDIVRFGGTNLGPAFINKCLHSTRQLMREYGWTVVD